MLALLVSQLLIPYNLRVAESGVAILLHHRIGELLGRYKRVAKERTFENTPCTRFSEQGMSA
jgi:hypothetical protein